MGLTEHHDVIEAFPPDGSDQPLGVGRTKGPVAVAQHATRWIVGTQWSTASPHALEIEPGRAVTQRPWSSMRSRSCAG